MDSLNNLDKFLAKIRNHRICYGMVISLTDPAVSELSGDIGYDFLWIDHEHGAMTINDIKAHIMAVRGTDCAPLVRVPWNEHGIIKPILELAPAGIIIPMVCNAEQARAAVAACRYPPTGTRGCGIRRGSHYGMTPFNDYLQASEHDPLVIIQIEHIDAVRHLDEILEVPGIDSVCIGPCDLSGSMGKLNQLEDPEVNAVIDEIAEKVHRKGLILGTAAAADARARKRGFDWIAVCGDWGAMASAGRGALRSAKHNLEE